MSARMSESVKKGPVAWMAGHPVAANLLMLSCIVGGYLALRNIKQEVFPDFTIDEISITTSYPGASPEEIESGLLLAVEEAVRGLDGIDEVRSTAREGSGTVTVTLLSDVDPNKVLQDVKNAVDRITSLPEDTEEPQVQLRSHQRAVLTVVVFGQISLRVLHELAESMRDQFLQNPNITQTEISGVPSPEISIEIPQSTLRRYSLSLDDVAQRVRNASVDLPGGGMKTDRGEILVRVKQRRDYGCEFSRIPIITTSSGSKVLLGDIARIEDGFEDTDRYSRYNGKPAVMIEVYRVGDQTPLDVAGAVRDQLAIIEPTLPDGIHFAIEHDRSDVYRQRREMLLRNGAIGLVMVLIVLAVFLEARLAFWVMMGIPISFLGSFLFLPAMGVTINMISMFAYIIALGIVVDDAIVVGENVYHHRQEGLGLFAAAVRGTREVMMPVTFSILTNIAAFMPLWFMPGILGKIEGQIPKVVVVVFSFSLVECLFILPAHLCHGKQEAGFRNRFVRWLMGKQVAFSHLFREWVRNRYGPFLRFSLSHRYTVIVTALVVLMMTVAYAVSGRMGFSLFPPSESDFSQVEVVLPYGSSVRRTEEMVRKLREGVEVVKAHPLCKGLVESVSTEIGLGGSHTGRIRVSLDDEKQRDEGLMSTTEFTDRWRDAVGEIAGVENIKFSADARGPGGGHALTIELTHRSIEVLAAASADLAENLETYPQVKDVDDGFQLGKEQLDLAITPEGESLGLTARTIARQVRNAFYGAEVARQQRGRDEIKVMVRLPERARHLENTMENLMVMTPAGSYVLLREVALVNQGRAYTTINRRNGRRVIQVGADVSPRSQAGKILADLQGEFLRDLKRRYPGLQYSFEGHRAEMRESFDSLKFTFSLAMLVVYALLAIPFRSYAQPFLVMMSIPFGIVGAVFGHFIMGFDLCMFSVWGIVALSGVVVNDSLVMIEFANRRHRGSGMAPADAIVAAGVQRFRPIVLTTLTTFAGVAPIVFDTSRQARFVIPMALSLGFGILFSTLITLVLLPSLYMVGHDIDSVLGSTKADDAGVAQQVDPNAYS